MKQPPIGRKSYKREIKSWFVLCTRAIRLEKLRNRWRYHKLHNYNRSNLVSSVIEHFEPKTEESRIYRWFLRGKTKKLPLVIVHLSRPPIENDTNTIQEQSTTKALMLERSMKSKLNASHRQYKLKNLTIDEHTQRKFKTIPNIDVQELVRRQDHMKKTFAGTLDVRINYYGPNVLKTICIPFRENSFSRPQNGKASIVLSNGTIIRLPDQSCIQNDDFENRCKTRRKMRSQYLLTKQNIQDFYADKNAN